MKANMRPSVNLLRPRHIYASFNWVAIQPELLSMACYQLGTTSLPQPIRINCPAIIELEPKIHISIIIIIIIIFFWKSEGFTN